MTKRFEWRLAYTKRLRQLTHCGFWLAWESSGICYDDLKGDFDTDVVGQYEPEDMAYEEALCWAQDS